ncbi:MAG TPA: NfeD family protein [Rubrivivax sp.]|nr:NfeD family protein [Rubrivivax sp.]
MDWSSTTYWWIAGGVLVAAELASGTFYLLMLAVGCVAGALAGHLGLSETAQVAAAAVVGGGATALWHFKRYRNPRSAPAEANRDVNIDIGQVVRVDDWQDDGTARVNYRGASWTVRHAGDAPPQPGDHVIVAVHGSVLSVRPRAPA